jgi:serine/threonine-protein kinase RsbW
MAAGEGWHRQTVRSRAEVSRLLQDLASAMAAEGYAEADIFDLRLALDEAIKNAVEHGHQGDSTLPIHVSYQLSSECVLAEVEDQGTGFNPATVPDPLSAENLGQPHGRGLFLMRSLTTWLRHNPRGNCVTLCKQPSAL